MVPERLSKLLQILEEKYNRPPVYIAENDAQHGNGMNDDFRIKYLYKYSHMR